MKQSTVTQESWPGVITPKAENKPVMREQDPSLNATYD